MTILLLGKSGQVGQALHDALCQIDSVTALSRADIDLAHPNRLAMTLNSFPSTVIVNAAAYTDVDGAESEPSVARRVNSESVSVIANHAAQQGKWLIHYSTDYVFDGAGVRPWLEVDEPAPINVYGLTKYEGEVAIACSGARNLTFRTSWVHGLGKNNFVHAILKRALKGDKLKVVNDQVGAPTSAEHISQVTAAAIRTILDGGAPPSGLYHLAASGETSWFSYAQLIVREALLIGLPLITMPHEIVPITTADYVTPAARPLNSRLNTSKLTAQFGLRMPSWEDGVINTIRNYARSWQ